MVTQHMAVDSDWMKDEEKKEYFVRKPSSGSDFNPHEFMADGTAHGKVTEHANATSDSFTA